MQKSALHATLFLTVALGSTASAQESPPDLARARTAFASADADQSGGVSLAEATAAGHTQAEFRGFDLDGDGALTHGEFIVGYKERMSAGGRRVASDLENEARRILTQRRAEQAEEARRREEAAGQGPAARRSEAMREKIRTSGADPLRVRSQAGDKLGGGDAGADPKSRAAGALRDLQSRRSSAEPPANAPAPNAGAPASNDPARANAPGANVPPVNVPPAETAGPNAGANAGRPPSAQGPAAGRVDPEKRMSPEELQRLFRQRRERAAADSAGDPRVEAERERERARAERAAGQAGQNDDATRGSARGAGAAERGSTGASGRSSRARPAGGRPRGGG